LPRTHREEIDIAAKLENEFSNPQIKIHFDYCTPEFCPYCAYDVCTVRKEKRSKHFNLDVKKLTGDAVFRI